MELEDPIIADPLNNLPLGAKIRSEFPELKPNLPRETTDHKIDGSQTKKDNCFAGSGPMGIEVPRMDPPGSGVKTIAYPGTTPMMREANLNTGPFVNTFRENQNYIIEVARGVGINGTQIDQLSIKVDHLSEVSVTENEKLWKTVQSLDNAFDKLGQLYLEIKQSISNIQPNLTTEAFEEGVIQIIKTLRDQRDEIALGSDQMQEQIGKSVLLLQDGLGSSILIRKGLSNCYTRNPDVIQSKPHSQLMTAFMKFWLKLRRRNS